MIRYRRLGSTLFPDGTLVNDQLLGGAETLYTFPLPATGPTMSTVLPPAISGANMVRPFLDYEVQVAAVNLFDIGPYSNLSFGSALTAGWCLTASRAPDWVIVPAVLTTQPLLARRCPLQANCLRQPPLLSPGRCLTRFSAMVL